MKQLKKLFIVGEKQSFCQANVAKGETTNLFMEMKALRSEMLLLEASSASSAERKESRMEI